MNEPTNPVNPAMPVQGAEPATSKAEGQGYVVGRTASANLVTGANPAPDGGEKIQDKITQYLSSGGLFNPELMEHEKVRDLILHCRDRIAELEREVAESRAQVDAKSSLLCNIADTLRSRGFEGPAHLDERVIALAQERDSLRRQMGSLAERFNCKPEEAVQVALTFATTTDGVLTQLRQQVARLEETAKEVKMLAEQMNQISEALIGYREGSFETILETITENKERIEQLLLNQIS